MKRSLSGNEFEIIRKELLELGYGNLASWMTPDNTSVNGATVFGCNENPDGVLLRYVEDEVEDEKGNPYIFEYPYYEMYGEYKVGKRLIALYVEDAYILLPLNGESFVITGVIDEEKAKSVDVSKSMKLPTPQVLKLPKDAPREIRDEDLVGIKQAIQKYGKYTAASIAGTVAMSLLCFMLVGLIYIFSVTALDDSGLLSGAVFGILSIIALAALTAGIIGSIRFFKNIYLRNALKMRYIKKVMVIGVHKVKITDSVPVNSISFYEWVDGQLKANSCDIGVGTVFFDEKVGYGSIVNMLTKEANQGIKLIDSRIFCTMRGEK